MARAQPGHLQVVCRMPPAKKIVSPLHVRSFLPMFKVKTDILFFHIGLTPVIFASHFFLPLSLPSGLHMCIRAEDCQLVGST